MLVLMERDRQVKGNKKERSRDEIALFFCLSTRGWKPLAHWEMTVALGCFIFLA